jgi:NAD(P)H-nitrite reductase large subunit
MHLAYPLPTGWIAALTEETVVCRCEEVTVGAVRAVCERHGAGDARQVKQLSRAGMGWCQGRVCGFAADCLAAEFTGAPSDRPPAPAERPIAAPITLGALADAKLDS